jgi:hypothetical protein
MNKRSPGISTYPLSWPPGWPRTPSEKRERSKFVATTLARALSFLEAEVRRLGGKGLVLSSNYTLGPAPKDVGVCAYFEYEGTSAAIPCDRWTRVEDNLHAIGKTIEAMRGIERWGAKHMVKAAFTGFAALPAPGSTRPWRIVLGVSLEQKPGEIHSAYKKLRSQWHPDREGGDAGRFDEVQKAYEQARSELGLP